MRQKQSALAAVSSAWIKQAGAANRTISSQTLNKSSFALRSQLATRLLHSSDGRPRWSYSGRSDLSGPRVASSSVVSVFFAKKTTPQDERRCSSLIYHRLSSTSRLYGSSSRWEWTPERRERGKNVIITVKVTPTLSYCRTEHGLNIQYRASSAQNTSLLRAVSYGKERKRKESGLV